MAFMELQIYRAGTLASCECRKCGMTQYAHEWIADRFNDERDAMQDGTFRCVDCGYANDPATFHEQPRTYAGRYSAPGYMDCTDWSYDTNKRRLARELRAMYCD